MSTCTQNRMSPEAFRAHCEQAKWWASAPTAPSITRAEALCYMRERRQEMHRAEIRRNDPGPQKELPNV